jgi:hypothetical protein
MSTCRETLTMTPDEVRACSVDFGDSTAANVRSGKLDAGELLTGTPTVTQHSSVPSDATALTLASKAVNTATIEINGRDCLAGEAVQFTATGGDADAKYVVSVKCSTDATPAQTLEAFVVIRVEDG